MAGVDSISFEGDEIEARRHVAMARKCLDALRRKLGSNTMTASTQMRVSDRAYVIALVGPGISRAIIVAGYTPRAEEEEYPREISDVPDFLSGVALGSRIVTAADGAQSMETFWPTAPCAQAFGLDSNPAPIARLAVKPDQALAAQWPEPPATLVPAQSMRVVPTMYSGKMREVVQFLLGFGKEPERSRYDREPPLLARYGRDAEQEQAVPLYERRVADTGRTVLYDWSFARTHGIATATDNALWLVEISVQHGVVIMPLPLNELTQDPRFREKLEAMGDTAGLTALDAFDAWPTGEAFPTGDALEQAKRSGIVIELLPPAALEPIYGHYSPYSTAMGWSFDARGREAHATAWRYASDRIQRGAWFSVRLTISNTTSIEDAPEARSIMIRIAQLDVGDERRWLEAKTKRMTRTQCSAVLSEPSPADALAALRALELDPIAIAGATFVRVQEGPLYWPGRYQPWIQFPEPRLGYCVSHVMRQQFGPNIINPPRCDTVVHVLHQGGQLRTVRFLSDPRPATPPDTDTFEACAFEGEWETVQTSGGTYVQPTMVTSDQDDRTEASGIEQRAGLLSTAIGYTSVVVVDSLSYPPHGQMSRTRSFRQRHTSSLQSGPSIAGVIRVPFFDRSAYYYAYGRAMAVDIYTETWGYAHLKDPTMYSTWRNFGGYTRYRGNVPVEEHPAGCGPVVARTVWAEQRGFVQCEENADQGSWASTCDNADSMVYNTPLPQLPAAVFRDRSGIGLLRVQLFNDSQQSPISVVNNPTINAGTWAYQQWFATSPDPDTFDTQYMAATCNAFGDRVQTVYSAHPNGDTLINGGPQIEAMRHAQCTYVGVVDG